MARHSPFRTDLIVGMTLAELFLLILFVVWSSQGPGAGPDWKDVADQQQRQINALKAEIKQDRVRIDELEKIREFWRNNFNVEPPSSIADMTTALRSPAGQALKQELLRGFPKCNEDNVLVAVFVNNGQSELRIRRPVNVVEEWGRSAGVKLPAVGDRLTEESTVTMFFANIDRFYSYRKANTKPCRFDYSLTWTTDSDYRTARERLEAYFYPAGITAARSR